MTLGQKQEVFLYNVGRLIVWAFENGYHLRPGELQRTVEQQRFYFETGKSKTMESRHIDKLAIDLYLIVDGKLAPKYRYAELAAKWKSLDPDNVAGYDWAWDANHFEMRP